MTTYFDSLERDIRGLSEQTRGDEDAFLDGLGAIEKTLAETALLNSGDREFPDDLRNKILGAVALHSTTDCNGAKLGEDFYRQARVLAATMRRSRLVGSLHSVFHELAGRRIETRFGLWTDDPAANLKARDKHDEE